MVTQLISSQKNEIIYPDCDGQSMSDNTLQFAWITKIKSNLDALFRDNLQVFIAGDLLWYPIEGDNRTRRAPDTMVVFGRPKGYRGSYRQWQEANIAPQVVFEILSPGNTLTEMALKLKFYERYGVEEYYLYDPDSVDLSGWLREGDRLEVIEEINNWVSPRLGIKFSLDADRAELEIYRPDGQKFLSYEELDLELENMRQQVDEERQQKEKLLARLKELGIDPE